MADKLREQTGSSRLWTLSSELGWLEIGLILRAFVNMMMNICVPQKQGIS
jgi:hypothetical protein